MKILHSYIVFFKRRVLQREGVLNFTKGLPTSLAMGSEQQWDKENAWPPMIHMVIEGFRTTGDPKLMKVVFLSGQVLKERAEFLSESQMGKRVSFYE